MNIVFIVITVISLLVALPQVWGASWKSLYRYYIDKSITWDTVHRSAIELLSKFKSDSVNFDVIVAVGRGGLIASGLICSEMIKEELKQLEPNEEPDVSSFKISALNTKIGFRKTTTKKGVPIYHVDKIDIVEIDCDIIETDQILILLAQTFSGSTLSKAIDFLTRKGIKRENIKTATLFWQKIKIDKYHSTCNHEPDYFGIVQKDKRTMPWKTKKYSTDRV